MKCYQTLEMFGVSRCCLFRAFTADVLWITHPEHETAADNWIIGNDHQQSRPVRSLHPSHLRWTDESRCDTEWELWSLFVTQRCSQRQTSHTWCCVFSCLCNKVEVCHISSLRPSATYFPPLPVCKRAWLTDTCPSLTYSISGARVPQGRTVTPDRAKWQSNATHIANHWNLWAVYSSKTGDVCVCALRDDVRWLIWFGKEAF